jgi:hypothetical protein
MSSFKHYRQRQLEHAINTLELGLPPYKVDQLKAMRWVREAWASIDISVFVNCWRHTKILDTEAFMAFTAASKLSETEAHGNNQIPTLLATFPIENPMSIANFLTPI